MLFEERTAGGDYERLVAVQDEASGLRAIIVLHSLRRGPAFGGIRRRRYDDETAALHDAMRLAESMSLKCALAQLDAGGGKTVILDDPRLDRAAAYAALGAAIADLGGNYVCGPDVGTGEAELDQVRAKTRWVNPVGNDAGASTAAGVLAGLRGVLRVLDGQEDFGGRRYAVQGLGSVGLAVVKALRETGAAVVGHDVNPRARERARELGATILEGPELLETDCDVFMPCALGGVIDERVASRLRCRAVCGSANNQLSTGRAGNVLHERDIAYAPDFCVNAGAVIEGVITVGQGQGKPARDQVAEAIGAITETTEHVLREARASGRTPEAVAESLARARLEARADADAG
jgi:leucine dehydrogenase